MLNIKPFLQNVQTFAEVNFSFNLELILMIPSYRISSSNDVFLTEIFLDFKVCGFLIHTL